MDAVAVNQACRILKTSAVESFVMGTIIIMLMAVDTRLETKVEVSFKYIKFVH